MKRSPAISVRYFVTGLVLLSLVLFALQAMFPNMLVGTSVAYLLIFMTTAAAAIGFAITFRDRAWVAASCAGLATTAFALAEIAHEVALGVMLKGGTDFVLMEAGGLFTVASALLGAVAAIAAFWLALIFRRWA